MQSSHYRISLDVHRCDAAVTLHCKRYDTGRRILAALTDGGAPYRIDADCRAVFTARKPDGHILYNDCTIDGNTVCYDLTPQTTAAAGMVLCELRIYSGETLLTSPRFCLHVDETVYAEGDVIESADEVTTLTGLIADIEQKLENGELRGEPFTYADFTPEQLEDLRASIYGYYVPSVENGILSWTPTGDTMPAAPDADLRPVKGVDYFTAADRAELVEAVQAAGNVAATYTFASDTELDAAISDAYAGMPDASAQLVVMRSTTADHTLGAVDTYFVRLFRTDGNSGSLRVSSGMRRSLAGGIWGAWEWENPPLILGVEYRTPMRYQGKPVYTKVVDLGALPAATRKSVVWNEEQNGIPLYMAVLTSARGAVISTGKDYTVSVTEIVTGCSYVGVTIETTLDLSATTAVALIVYAKTTD